MIDIDEIKAANPLSSVISAVTQLSPSCNQLVGRCPFHEDRTPSFFVNDVIGRYHCFGCRAKGDVITFVQEYNNISFLEAVSFLKEGLGVQHRSPRSVPKVPKGGDSGKAAKAIWSEASSILGSPAEAYLAARGIDLGRLPELPALRFSRLRHPALEGSHAALVAGISDPAGAIVSIQRIFLTENGRKLPVKAPKLSLGPRPGGAIRLGTGEEDIIICEGLEDGLSLLSELPDQTVWAAAGAGMMKSIVLPSACRSVTIARDNDGAGMAAAQDAERCFRTSGRTVYNMVPPPPFKDFNEMLCARSLQ